MPKSSRPITLLSRQVKVHQPMRDATTGLCVPCALIETTMGHPYGAGVLSVADCAADAVEAFASCWPWGVPVPDTWLHCDYNA